MSNKRINKIYINMLYYNQHKYYTTKFIINIMGLIHNIINKRIKLNRYYI